MQVRFENVTLKFDDKTILDNINFTLPDKELISFLGPSGSGKSTTLYLISGLLEATSGKIYFDDTDVTHLDSVKRGIGLVFQNYALYPHMTVLDNIMYPLKMAKVPKKERKEKAIEMARLTQIDEHLDKFPSQLSGGQQQRVAISRALAKKPKILLMDEPLSNLDARLRIEMRQEIRRIQQETGITTVFVTHDQEEALSISDSVMVLHDGAIQQMSDPISLYKFPNNLFVSQFIGTPVINIFTRENSELNKKHPLMDKNWHYLGVRAEHLQLANAQEYLLEGQIDSIDYVGKDTTVHVKNHNHTFEMLDRDHLNLKVGDTIFLNANKEDILLFDSNGLRMAEDFVKEADAE